MQIRVSAANKKKVISQNLIKNPYCRSTEAKQKKVKEQHTKYLASVGMQIRVSAANNNTAPKPRHEKS